MLDPIEEPIRTADDIQRLVYKPVNNAANDFLMNGAAVAGPNNPYKAYAVCHQAALDFNLYVVDIQYALKTSKPLPAIALRPRLSFDTVRLRDGDRRFVGCCSIHDG